MSQRIPIFIPTFISDQTYNPTRVLPHIYFYNGLIDCQKYYIESGSLTNSGLSIEQNAFPYFDNYNVVTGSFPTIDSLSLLFYNEQAAYGETPTETLYSTYWSQYVDLLYNPRTRLFNASAIIPLADYFQMELNDIVEWRGNYYHLRAINDYNLSNGECNIQLLGPVIGDVISNILPIYDCNFDFSVTIAIETPPTISFYQADISPSISRTVYYTDYNGVARSEAFNAVRSYKFAAISGSVSFSNPLGCTLTTISNSFTPNFQQYDIFFGPSQYPTYYINWQDVGGTIENYTNYTYPSTACVVSGSFTATGGLNWPVGYWRLTNTAACPPEPNDITLTITLTEKFKKAGPNYEVYYSDDCNDYTYLETIELPNIGDDVNVTVPYTSSCIKLVSLGDCTNAVVHVIPGALGGDFNIDFSFADFNVF